MDEGNDGLTIVETIDDSYRLGRLKARLSTRVLTKRPSAGSAGHMYYLIFLDDQDQIVAACLYYYVHTLSYILQPTRYAYKKAGHYHIGLGPDYPYGVRHYLLRGNWDSAVSYKGYVIPFADWAECIGYTPPL